MKKKNGTCVGGGADATKCDGMRKDGTCGNGYCDNHNKKCRGATCPERFHYQGVGDGSDATGKMPVAPANNYRDRVSNQYAAIETAKDNLLRECVKFGALLTEVSYFLGETQGRKGEGLQAWLEENCPEVNYSTAMGYKALATKCVKMIGGGSQAVAALQDKTLVQEPGTGDTIDVDGDFIRKRDELFAEVKSRRELEQTYFAFMASEGKRRPGRPKGSGAGEVAPRAKTAEVKAAEAEAEMRELVGKLGAYLTRGGKVGMLTAQARDDFHRALVDYANQLAEMM